MATKAAGAKRPKRPAASNAGKPARPTKAKAQPKAKAKTRTVGAAASGPGAKPKRGAKGKPQAKGAPLTKQAPTAGDAWILVDPSAAQSDPWARPPPAAERWELVEPAAPLPSARRPPAKPFDPATGAWLSPASPSQGSPEPAPDRLPEARKRDGWARFWTALLVVDLVFLALNAVASIVAGLILVFAPGSSAAETFRDAAKLDSPAALLTETLLTFTLFGVIPFLWVLGTRVEPVEGTRRYLHLQTPGPAILRGVLLAVPLLVAVAVLSAAYTLATEGIDGLTHPDESVNPVVEGILDNLSWPLAVLVALCAGLGEEILFRGVLQRWIGLWGQAVLFGLAHAAGGYPPQVLFAFGLGVLFGHLVKRGWSLWTLVTAHAVYDLTLLAIGLATR